MLETRALDPTALVRTANNGGGRTRVDVWNFLRRRFDQVQARLLTGSLSAPRSSASISSRPIDEETKSRLYRYFADYAVLVFRDQHFDPPRFAAAAQLFGDIIPEQFDNYRLPEYPLVSSLSNRDLEQTGRHRAVRGADFHTDHPNYPAPPKATVLYGIVIPQSGGDTSSPRYRPPMTTCPRHPSAGSPD